MSNKTLKKQVNIAVQLDIATYNQITETLENFALYKLIEENNDNETLSLKDAKEFYKNRIYKTQ
jgi:hypothetical protein